MSARTIKLPQEISPGMVIPVWGDDLVVDNAKPMVTAGRNITFVTFTDGSTAAYAPGTAIAVIIDERDPNIDHDRSDAAAAKNSGD
mgnify:CR=1 FL=1